MFYERQAKSTSKYLEERHSSHKQRDRSRRTPSPLFAHILPSGLVMSPLLSFSVENWSLTNGLHVRGGSRYSARRTWNAGATSVGREGQVNGYMSNEVLVRSSSSMEILAHYIYFTCMLTKKLLFLTTEQRQHNLIWAGLW